MCDISTNLILTIKMCAAKVGHKVFDPIEVEKLKIKIFDRIN